MALIDLLQKTPTLTRFLKEVPEGTYLFKQGDPASTMFYILRGVLELRAETKDKSRLVSLAEPRQILGEKVLISPTPFPRALSAKAKGAVLVLEVSAKDLDEINRASPEAYADLTRQMFQTAVMRLDRSNYLIRVLRSSDNVERLIHLIFFLCRAHGRKSPEGVDVSLPTETFRYYIDMEEGSVEDCLNELVIEGLLSHHGEDAYTVINEKKLLGYVPTLSHRFKSGHFDELEAIP